MSGEWQNGSWAELVKVPAEFAHVLNERKFQALGYGIEELGCISTLAVAYGGLSDGALPTRGDCDHHPRHSELRQRYGARCPSPRSWEDHRHGTIRGKAQTAGGDQSRPRGDSLNYRECRS